MMMLLLTICASCTIGPVKQTEYVVAHPGQPGQVVENTQVLLMPAGASQPVKQDIGGWMVMPQDHFDALMNKLKKEEEKK